MREDAIREIVEMTVIGAADLVNKPQEAIEAAVAEAMKVADGTRPEIHQAICCALKPYWKAIALH